MCDRLNALWFGKELGYVEKLCIVSAQSVGHALTLYSYEPNAVTGVPSFVEVRDAREVMSDTRRTRLFESNFKALGSDFFRYEIFAKELGFWVDLDIIFLKKLQFDNPYVFGWEHPKSINGAVLRLPKDSEMLNELRNIPESNWCPPYFGPKRKASFYWHRITKGGVRLEELPWGAAGPGMITHLARKYGKLHLAQPKAVFYPLDYEHALKVFEPAEVVEGFIRPETRTVHLWNSKLRDLVSRPPPEGSFLAKACRKFDIA